jgi:hypothetical protein
MCAYLGLQLLQGVVADTSDEGHRNLARLLSRLSAIDWLTIHLG